MTNIVDEVKTWLIGKIETPLFASMTTDTFSKSPDAIKILGDPSSAVETEFIDGSTRGSQQITFYARSKTPKTCIDTLNTIYAEFNQPEISLTQLLCVSVQPVTLCSFVSKETTGESIYSMTVKIDFDEQNSIGV